MGLGTVKRLAASIMGVGESRVRIMDAKKAGEALTRDDVRGLIASGTVLALPKSGVGRAKAAAGMAKKRSGRGRGSRKGSRAIGKIMWMRKTRAQRKFLAKVKARLEKGAYRRAYRMVKGNAFKDVAGLRSFLTENKLLK
ncbi:MAG: 50S ribosomal protein L19e [Candidatus Micrarchaeota archaeon]|nr:50S ribosomal protein L19e [Candidatus Micrarchaeota archaeon]